jgi:hypothetical protein
VTGAPIARPAHNSADYSAWHQFDSTLAGVQQCVAHLFRHLHGVVDLDPAVQAWAGKTREVLREAHTAA